MYKVIIIGSGNKGALADAPGTGNENKYLSYGHAVQDHAGYELLGFSDIDKIKAINAASIWGGEDFCIPQEYCEDCEDRFYHKADVIIVANPDDMHYETLSIIADYYPKLVICEKPLCTSLEQAVGIVGLYQSRGIPLLLDYTRRFIPYWQRARADVNKAGEFLKGYCYFNRGVAHTLSHFIDLALWFKGNLDGIHIEEVEASYQWVFQWGLFYEKDFFSEHAVNFVKNPQVDSIYDKHLWYVMDNAYNFLEGKEALICTAEDGLKALQECIRLEGLR